MRVSIQPGTWRLAGTCMMVLVPSVISLPQFRKQLLNAQVTGGETVSCLPVVAENRFTLPAVVLYFYPPFISTESPQSSSPKEIVFGSNKQAFSKMVL